MLPIFNTKVKRVVSPDYDSHVGGYKEIVENAITKGVVYYVKNQHPLVRIVRRIYDMDSDMMLSYRRNMSSVHDYLRKMLYTGFDSEGRPKKNPFFKDDLDSYMIYNLAMPDIDLMDPDIIDPYKFTPLKFISHSKTQLTMFPLDGSVAPKGKKTITYTELHVGELILAFRSYMRLLALTGSKPDVARFVCSFVLTPAFKSYANIALFNRFHAINLGEELYKDPVDKRWGVFNYNKELVDKAMIKVYASNQKWRIRDILGLQATLDDMVDFYILKTDRNIINTSFNNMSRLETLVKTLELIPDRYRKKFNRSERATIIQRFDRGLHEELNRPFAGENYDLFKSKINYIITLLDR